MYNFSVPYLPERTSKPRSKGITMVMDKGLSVNEAENLVSSSGNFVDFVKLGFGTAFITPNLDTKIKIYKEANIQPYFGGTLFEIFASRNLIDEYKKLIDKYKLEVVEISDGSIRIEHEEKCKLINDFSKNYKVLSEVGSKESGILISPSKWIKMMSSELEAGAWKVIAEARESGNVGIYRPSGNAHTLLINKILTKINADDIIWETPLKSQQVWFVKLLGANVNVGNIAPNDVISLETIRLGLRGDTFFNYLPKNIADSLIQKNQKKN